MDPLILGQTLVGKSPTVFYGFWMPAGGNKLIASIDVILVSAASQFTLKIQTKNSEDADPGSGSNIIGSQSINSTTPGVFKAEGTNAKEWIRYLLTADDASDNYIHFQYLNPQWVPN
jgi:hypothetical protein